MNTSTDQVRNRTPMPGRPTERAVITGIGVVAPTGLNTDQHWRSVLSASGVIGPITRFDASGYSVGLAGQVPGFTARDVVPGRLIPQTDHFTQLALAAAAAACQEAALEVKDLPDYDVAVVTASSSGGTEFGQHEMERLYRNGPDWVGAYQSIAWFYAASSGQISIRHGTRGPSGVVCTEQAGGLDALSQACRVLEGGTRIVLAGGTDASLCPYGLVAQIAGGRMSTDRDPRRAYRPFAADACGYLPGEGGAMLVLESEESADERGRPWYAALVGHASGFDPAPRTNRPPALARVIRAALQDAGMSPAQVGVVLVDGAANVTDDIVEAQALEEVFGPWGVPVTVPKAAFGRLYAGGGALDVATAALAIRDRVIPPTVTGWEAAVDYRLDLVGGAPRELHRPTALVVARGHGGFTSAAVLHDPRPQGGSPQAGTPAE